MVPQLVGIGRAFYGFKQRTVSADHRCCLATVNVSGTACYAAKGAVQVIHGVSHRQLGQEDAVGKLFCAHSN